MKQKKGDETILCERVSTARMAAGFSLAEAAKLLGFNNYQSLSQIEKGKRMISAHELSIMARLYGRSLDYFFEPEVSPDPVPLWRKSVKVSIEQVQRQFLSFLENYSNMENLLGLKRRWKDIQKNYDKHDFLARSFKLADQLGSEICESLNLGSRPASNLLNVLENSLRIKILHLPLENGISGACVVDGNLGAGILINTEDVLWRRNFDLAHELFHIVTWNVFSYEEVGDGTVKTRPEQYADAFASSLLLPELHLRNALEEIATDSQIRIVDVIELAIEFGVSTEAILWRLVNLEVLTKREVEKVLGSPEFRRKDHVTRQGLFYEGAPPKFPGRYISLACRCLIEGKISRGTFAEYLGIDRAEIDRYLRKQGFAEENYEKIAAA